MSRVVDQDGHTYNQFYLQEERLGETHLLHGQTLQIQ